MNDDFKKALGAQKPKEPPKDPNAPWVEPKKRILVPMLARNAQVVDRIAATDNIVTDAQSTLRFEFERYRLRSSQGHGLDEKDVKQFALLVKALKDLEDISQNRLKSKELDKELSELSDEELERALQKAKGSDSE